MKPKKFISEEEEIEAIRRDPKFRALVNEIKSLTPKQVSRLLEWLEEQAKKEEANESKEP